LAPLRECLIHHPFTRCDISGVEYFYEFMENSQICGLRSTLNLSKFAKAFFILRAVVHFEYMQEIN